MILFKVSLMNLQPNNLGIGSARICLLLTILSFSKTLPCKFCHYFSLGHLEFLKIYKLIEANLSKL